MRYAVGCRWVVAAAFIFAASSQGYAADGGKWAVTKSSGHVWISNSDAQPVALTQENVVKAGDTIRTGQNGRVLLTRGEESILIAPNSVVGIPTEPERGLSTTIVQKAGSILLDVEKRNVKHFEVETPYLAAVVKGTQFRVSVNAANTSVSVMRGQVEVSDFKSGQIAQVMPGQKATVFEHGKTGLSLSGTGTFKPIEQGKPRPSSVNRVPVPKRGLSAPRHAQNGTIHNTEHSSIRSVNPQTAVRAAVHSHPIIKSRAGVHIRSALGEVKLNVHKVTHGLARNNHGTVNGSGRSASNDNTVWSAPASGQAVTSNAGNSNSGSPGAPGNGGAGGGSSAASVAAATNAGVGNGVGKGSANGNGNAYGFGNGNAYGHANGNGNGNGNSQH